MNLIKCNPRMAGGMRSFAMDPVFPNVFDRFFDRDLSDVMGSDFATNVPSVNVSESTEGYQLDVAAPGLTKADFRIAVDKNKLTISAEKSSDDTLKEGRYTRREFNYTTFSRTFILPDTIDKDGISAKYEEGVLKVAVPKKAEVVKEEKGRVIEIA